jgi:hypothetical protein
MSQSKGRVRRGERGLFGQAAVEIGDRELVRTVRLAVRVARRHLGATAHVNVPRKFARPQPSRV